MASRGDYAAFKPRAEIPSAAEGSVSAGKLAVSYSAQVGEWLKPTDCKSVPPSEVRRFESFPVHQNFVAASLFGRHHEPLGDGDHCVPGFGCAGVYHAERSADSGGNACDPRPVRV